MGPTAKVFLMAEVTEELAIRVDAELRSQASEVTSTRKGLDWEIRIGPDGEATPRPRQVHLWNTGNQLWDCEDVLREIEMDASSLPAHIAFSAGCNEAVDYELLERVTKAIAGAMDGIATEPVK